MSPKSSMATMIVTQTRASQTGQEPAGQGVFHCEGELRVVVHTVQYIHTRTVRTLVQYVQYTLRFTGFFTCFFSPVSVSALLLFVFSRLRRWGRLRVSQAAQA